MLVVLSVVNPRIGLRRAVNLPWSPSHRLLSYSPLPRNVAGIRPSITFARAEARAVMTSVGVRCPVSDVVKNPCADGISRRLEKAMSMT